MKMFKDTQAFSLKGLFAAALLIALGGTLRPGAKQDFSQKTFDMGSIVATDPLDLEDDAPENFAKLAEEALALMAEFEATSLDILLFKNALTDAKFTDSSNPLQSQMSRVNTVSDTLNKYLASSPRDPSILTGGAPKAAPRDGFRPLVDFISEQYKALRGKSSMSATEADGFASDLDDMVKKEAPGVVDSGQINTIKLRLRSINNHDLFEGEDRTGARDILKASLDFVDDMTMSDRIDFLDRIWDSSDDVFGKGKGENRFLTVVDYIVQRFDTLVQDELDSLYWILEEATGRDDFGPNTQGVAKSILENKNWTGGATVSADETSDDTTSTEPSLSAADLRQSVETAETNLNSKLIRLVSEDQYDEFLGELEAATSNYRELFEMGEIKSEPAEGEVKDPLIDKMEKLAERVANNYRFQKAPYKQKTADIYNLAIGNLSLDQRLDRFSRDQLKVKSDTDAIAFVDRVKNELVFNTDGSLKDSVAQMPEEEKDALIAFVKSLRSANFFGAAGSALSNIETAIKSGVGVDQLISDVKAKLDAVNDLSSMESFLIAIRDLKIKFDSLRVKGDISEDQRTNMINLVEATREDSRFWRLRQGKTKLEMDGMVASLKNPLSLSDRIAAMKTALEEIQDNPETVDLDDIEGLYAQTKKLVDDWQTARAIGLSEAKQNNELLEYLDLLSKSDEFYDYRSNFSSMTDRVKKSLSEERKIELIFDHMDSVLAAKDPAPKPVENFVSSAKLLGDDLGDLTGAQRTSLRAKVDSARQSDKFSAAQKSDLLSVENKLKDFKESDDASTDTSTDDSADDSSTDTTDDAAGDDDIVDEAPEPAPAPARPSPAARRRTPQRFSMSRGRRPTTGRTRTSSYGGSRAVAQPSRGVRARYRTRR